MVDGDEGEGDGDTMVFGDGNYADGDPSVSASASASTSGARAGAGELVSVFNATTLSHGAASGRREHKKMNKWGKKNKKMRQRDPYGDSAVASGGLVHMQAFSTNRSILGGGARGVAVAGDEARRSLSGGAKVRRHDPKTAYGSSYTRAVLPHHPSHPAHAVTREDS